MQHSPGARRRNRFWLMVVFLLVVGVYAADRASAAPEAPARARSLILVIADGMGVGQHTLAYYFGGRYPLARFEHVGLMTTHPAVRERVTDSGAAATALATGHKTDNAVIGMDAAGNRVETVLEAAESVGMVTGLVSTAAITDATPAAFAAHVPNRGLQEEIARQMTAAGIEVLLGGGRKYFTTDAAGNDLLKGLASRGVQVVHKLADVQADERPLLGLFAGGEMPVPPRRTPTLAAMTAVALDRLKGHPQGFFLLIEDEGTDTQSHRNNTAGVLAALDDVMATVETLLDYQATHPEVLLIFTGDHETGGLMLNGKGSRPGQLKWTTHGHTGNFLPIFASGPGSAAFDALLDNTEVGQLLLDFIRQP